MKKTGLFLFLVVLVWSIGPLQAETFQIRLYGGYSYLQGGDVNPGIGGLFSAYRNILSEEGIAFNGGFSPAHAGLTYGGDLIFQISRHFGIGVGTGFLKATKESTLSVITPLEMRIIGKPSYQAVPLRLGLFFTIPLFAGLEIRANVGGGYYMAKTASILKIETKPNPAIGWSDDAKANGFGAHGGVGLAFRLGGGFSLFVEAQGQMAKIGDFSGSTRELPSGDLLKGPLYYFEIEYGHNQYSPRLMCAPFPPPGPTYVNVRKAKIDFSGGQIVVGLSISL